MADSPEEILNPGISASREMDFPHAPRGWTRGSAQARIDEEMRSRQRLQAQQQFAREQVLGSDIARGFLESSFRPQEALIQSTLPGLDAAALSNVAGRQLGQYGSQLGAAALDYDINAEQLATDLRREALNSLFGLLISEQQAQGNRDEASGSPLASVNIGPDGFNLGGTLGALINRRG